jgi:hypothetical protein
MYRAGVCHTVYVNRRHTLLLLLRHATATVHTAVPLLRCFIHRTLMKYRCAACRYRRYHA